MKIVLTKLFKIIFILAIIAGIIMAIPAGYEAWRHFVKHKSVAEGFKRNIGMVWSFPFESYKCRGNIKFKPNELNKNVMYTGTLIAAADLSIDASAGFVFVRILDKDGFATGEFTIKNFVESTDKDSIVKNFVESMDEDRTIKLTFYGTLYDPIEVFENMVDVKVAHSLIILDSLPSMSH